MEADGGSGLDVRLEVLQSSPETDPPKKRRGKSKERVKGSSRDEVACVSGDSPTSDTDNRKRKRGKSKERSTAVNRDDALGGWKSGRVLGSITSMARRGTAATSSLSALKDSFGNSSSQSLVSPGRDSKKRSTSGNIFAGHALQERADMQAEDHSIPQRADSDSKMMNDLGTGDHVARKTFIGTTKIHLDDKSDVSLQRISSVHDRNTLPTLVIMGAAGTGKSALVDVLFEKAANELFPAADENDLEMDCRYGRVFLDGMDVVFRVIELPATQASQLEALPDMPDELSVIALYSIADDESLPQALGLVDSMRQLFAARGRQPPTVVLAANQIDLLGSGDKDMVTVFKTGRAAASKHDCKFLASTVQFSKTNAEEVFLCALLDACEDLTYAENSFIFDDGHRVAIEDYMSVLENDEWVRRYCAVKGEFLIEMNGQEPLIRYLSVCVPKRIGSCKDLVAWIIRLPSGEQVTFGTESPEKMNQWVDVVSRVASGRGQGDITSASPRGIVGQFSTLLAIASRMHCVDCGDTGCTWVSHHHKTYLCTACAQAHKSCLSSPGSGITPLETYSNKPAMWSCFYALCNEHFNMVWQAAAPGSALLTPSSSQGDRENFILLKYRERSFYSCRNTCILLRPFSKASTVANEMEAFPSPRGMTTQDRADEWKPRYLYLSPGGLLSINKDPEREVLLDTFHISCTSIVEGRKLGFDDLHMQLIGPHSSYLVKAGSAEDAQYWLTILSSSFLRTKGRSNVIQLDGFSVPASCFSRNAAASTPSVVDEDVSLDKVYSLLQLKMSLWSNQLEQRHTVSLKQSLEQKLQETIQKLREIDDTERKILSRVSRLEPTSIREEMSQLRSSLRRAGDFSSTEDLPQLRPPPREDSSPRASTGPRRGSGVQEDLDDCLVEAAMLEAHAASPSPLAFKQDQLVSAGLQHLTLLACQPDFEGGRFANTFLLTFPNFVTADVMLHCWCTSFAEPVTVRLDRSAANFGHIVPVASGRTARTLRKQTLRNIEQWLQEFWETDFLTDERLIITVLAFVDEVVEPMGGYFDHVEVIRELVQQRVESSVTEEHMGAATKAALDVDPKSGDFPRALLPKHGLKQGATAVDLLLEMDPLELARQLALLHHAMFRHVPSREFLRKRWMASNKEVLAPHLTALTKNFNDVSTWVASVVLDASRSRVRAKLVDACVMLAVRSAELRNYHAVIAIVGGLQDPAVRRLSKTWALVQAKAFGLLQDLLNRTSVKDNWAAYRQELAEAVVEQVPCVPFIGVFLKDLVFIFDGLPDKTITSDGGELVNFGKQRKIYAVLRAVEQLQADHYEFQQLPQVTSALETAFDRVADLEDAELFDLSCKLEPRSSAPSSSKRKETVA